MLGHVLIAMCIHSQFRDFNGDNGHYLKMELDRLLFRTTKCGMHEMESMDAMSVTAHRPNFL